jgi:hypothetical protein
MAAALPTVAVHERWPRAGGGKQRLLSAMSSSLGPSQYPRDTTQSKPEESVHAIAPGRHTRAVDRRLP